MSTKKATPAKASSFLSGRNQSGHLARMLAQQRSLLKKVQEILPEPVRSHCLHARIDRQQLILFTDSPVWKARIHYLVPNIIRQIQHFAPNLQTVNIKIYLQTTKKWPTPKKAKLSQKSAESILETADTVEDPLLRAALVRLGQHGNRES